MIDYGVMVELKKKLIMCFFVELPPVKLPFVFLCVLCVRVFLHGMIFIATCQVSPHLPSHN